MREVSRCLDPDARTSIADISQATHLKPAILQPCQSRNRLEKQPRVLWKSGSWPWAAVKSCVHDDAAENRRMLAHTTLECVQIKHAVDESDTCSLVCITLHQWKHRDQACCSMLFDHSHSRTLNRVHARSLPFPCARDSHGWYNCRYM